MNELENCPLCGNIPKNGGTTGGDVWCVNGTCRLFEIHIPRKFWNNRPIENSLRDDLAKLREEINDIKESFLEMRDKKDNLQNTLDGLKRDIQTVSTSYADMKKQRDILQKELEKYIDFEKKADANLKTRLSDLEKAHQYSVDDMQKRLAFAEEVLNTLITYNAKLDILRFDEYKTINSGLKKIKGEGKI